MDEKEYIYLRLKFISDEVSYLNEHVSELMESQEKLVEIITMMSNHIDKISSPEYIKKINQHNETLDVINKIDYIRNLTKK